MKLIFLSGPLADNRYDINRDITIGRDISNDIVLDDPAVSLVHVQISRINERFFIKDMGSTNGIILNGDHVVSAELKDGDGLTVGNSRIRIETPEYEILPTVAASAGDLPAATILVGSGPDSGPDNTDELTGNITCQVSYFLKRRIAKGGMGAIYEAEQIGAEGFIKKVAIKTILPVFALKESFVSSFVGEAKLVANLVHQNIVQIHHLGRHQDGYFIAMEYIDGINLTHFITIHRTLNLRTPVDIAVFIASRVARGLDYAHAKHGEDGEPLGLVHRDVSPNNIMINREGEVKLTDFGVAKAARFMEDDEDYLVGSVEYMSPEQADCRDIDFRSDLFSLGLVLYELLTGLRIFKCIDNNIEDTLEKVIETRIPDPSNLRSDIPESIINAMMRCLAREAGDRYSDTGQLVYDLEHAIYSKGYGPTISKMADYLRELEDRFRKATLTP